MRVVAGKRRTATRADFDRFADAPRDNEDVPKDDDATEPVEGGNLTTNEGEAGASASDTGKLGTWVRSAPSPATSCGNEATTVT